MIADASPQDLIPERNFLPPVDEWNAVPQDDLLEANEATRKAIFMPAGVLLSPSVVSLTSGFGTIFGRKSELRVKNSPLGVRG